MKQKKKMRTMDRMVEVLRTHIDDMVARWKDEELVYQVKLDDWSKEYDRLHDTLMQVEEELEAVKKQKEELVLQNINLRKELATQTEKPQPVIVETSKKWYQHFYK